MSGHRGTLALYRRLLHTMMKVFNGDFNMFHKVRLETRKKIFENRNETDEVKIQNLIFDGEEARDLLEKNLIQATLQKNGRYKMYPRKENGLGVNIKE